MESCVDVRCLDNGPTPTYVDAGLPRIDSHDCVRRRTLTCVNVRWRRTLPRLLNAHECNIVLRRRTSAYVVLVAVLRWRRTTLVLGIVLGLSEKNGSPTTQKSYDSVWPRLYSYCLLWLFWRTLCFNRNVECPSQPRVKECQQHFTKTVFLTSHGFCADLSEIILVELLSNIHRLPIPITWRFHKYWRPLDETQYCHNSCRAIVLCDTTEAVCCLYAVRSMTERMFAWQKLAGYLLQTQRHYQCYFHLVHIKQTNIKMIYTAYILMYI